MSTDQPRASDTPEDFQVPERRFTDAQLARLLEISSTVECECPNHLSKLVDNLVEFEAYSADCENRNEEDAAIHRMLYHSTARARSLMEEALVKLIEFEGIEI